MKMYEVAVKQNVDIVECRLWCVEKNSKRKTLRWADHNFLNFSGRNIITNVLNRNIWHIAANKIFHRTLLEKNLKFYNTVDKKIVVADDKLITIPMFFYANSYSSIKDRLYFYRYRDESSTNNRILKHDFRHIQDTYNVDKYLNSFFKEHADNTLFNLFEQNSDDEIRLIFKNILAYSKSSADRNYLYNAVIDIYGYKSLSVLHYDLEWVTPKKNGSMEYSDFKAMVIWHFKIILKCTVLFLYKKLNFLHTK
jgi:hypothetical protein